MNAHYGLAGEVQHDLRMDGGLPPGPHKGTHFLLLQALVLVPAGHSLSLFHIFKPEIFCEVLLKDF